jgi:hypothetical protein
MYKNVVCIPSCREFLYLPKAIQSLAKLPDSCLLIVLINCRENANPEVIDDNEKLHNWLLSFPHTKKQNEYWIEYPNLTILYLDYSSNLFRFTPKQGVGYARKILAEKAITLMEEGRIESPMIWCSDADAQFQNDYFHTTSNECSVLITPYLHDPAPPELQIYETSLRYYSLGLHWAKSPYAFPTIGSTISIHKETYKKIHGFSDRQAAEDFYLLNKAAKVGKVKYRSALPILLEGRPSDRVPFGTGMAMKRIKDNQLQWSFYHPKIFAVIKDWIEVLLTASDDILIDELNKIVPNFPAQRKWKNVLLQRCNEQTRIRRRFVLFDAFQTMKLIHFLRDTTFPDLPFLEALQQAEFLPEMPEELICIRKTIAELERQRMYDQTYGLASRF